MSQSFAAEEGPEIAVLRHGPVRVPLPAYQSPGAAGLDLHAALECAYTLQPGERRLIPTGLKLAIPPGFEGQIRPRSSLALRHGVTVVNSPGTIDSDFRGEVGIVLIHHGQQALVIQPQERIAQLVVQRVHRARLHEVTTLDATERGQGGYGSTGR